MSVEVVLVSPITAYPYKTKPFQHQLEALERSWHYAAFALFMEMGTGKTKVAIDNAALLYDRGEINGFFILCKKGAYRNWSDREIPSHFPLHITNRLAYWSNSPNKAERSAMEALFRPDDNVPLDIFVMNIEAMSTPKEVAMAEAFCRSHHTFCVVDESTSIKSIDAHRTKAVLKLGKYCKYRRIMTGAPVTKNPLDLFSQCIFLSASYLGFDSFYAFRNRYAIVQQKNFGARSVKIVVGYRNLAELSDKVTKFSYRVLKEDCLDLPPKVYELRDVELTTAQKSAYSQMKEFALSSLADGGLISAASVITQIIKLHQIACGIVLDSEGVPHEIENRRMDALLEILEDIDGKAIIWATYRQNIKSICARIAAERGASSVVSYYGDTSEDQRRKALDSFQDPKSDVKYFVGNPATGGHGITLTAARTVIYYSNSYDLEYRMQSEDRAHRIGQSGNKVTYVDLVCKNTVDEVIIRALRKKINLATTILGDDPKKWLI